MPTHLGEDTQYIIIKIFDHNEAKKRNFMTTLYVKMTRIQEQIWEYFEHFRKHFIQCHHLHDIYLKAQLTLYDDETYNNLMYVLCEI